MAESHEIIPTWNARGLLPPIRSSEEPTSVKRSPYEANLLEVVQRFSTSPERTAILNGLLRFRRALFDAGLEKGFQWLDGSFFENIEALEDRPPRDIDVVTFFDLKGVNQHYLVEHHSDLFDVEKVRESYRVDGYYFPIPESPDQYFIRRVSYWYSLWSHRRDHTWKGFVQVPLSPDQDSHAQALLNLNGGTRP